MTIQYHNHMRTNTYYIMLSQIMNNDRHHVIESQRETWGTTSNKAIYRSTFFMNYNVIFLQKTILDYFYLY